jgi:3-oxoacyl-[acyl-carrier protein] reductase
MESTMSTAAEVSKPLRGKTAIVTGSGRNIGRAIVLAFARAGANVVVNGHRDEAAVQSVVAEARALGVSAIGLMADVARHEQVLAMVRQAEQQLGGIDIAVSNVGIRDTRPLLDISPELWREVLDTNLSSAFFMAQAVLPGMKARGWGRIIHMAGRTAFYPKEERAHVSTSKSGLHTLAKVIALEFGPFGVTANTIAPGIIETARSNTTHPGYAAEFEKRSRALPVRRLGEVEDIAGLCLYLTSDVSGYVTGQVLHINGGEFMS